MMGPAKLKAIREEARNAFQMSEPEIFKWFNRQIQALARQGSRTSTEVETLRLLRDALLKETKRKGPRKRRKGVAGRAGKQT
jgi:hypothetical protein